MDGVWGGGGTVQYKSEVEAVQDKFSLSARGVGVNRPSWHSLSGHTVLCLTFRGKIRIDQFRKHDPKTVT